MFHFDPFVSIYRFDNQLGELFAKSAFIKLLWGLFAH